MQHHVHRSLLFAAICMLGGAVTGGGMFYAGYRLGLARGMVPAFASKPYEPFDRQEAVAIAMREWRMFGMPVDDEIPGAAPSATLPVKAERQPGMWQRVGEYFWVGLNANSLAHRYTGKHDGTGVAYAPEHDEDYAWSGAFISYVMRIAGAGKHFPYAENHSFYINKAWEASQGHNDSVALRAERPETYAPQTGDLICYSRDEGKALRFDELPRHFTGHCDIVVDKTTQGLSVIGGNVHDAVALKHVPVTASGTLADNNGKPVDSRYPWFVVLRVLYSH